MDIRCRLPDVMVSPVTAAPVCVCFHGHIDLTPVVFNGTVSFSQIVSGAKNKEEIFIRKTLF